MASDGGIVVLRQARERKGGGVNCVTDYKLERGERGEKASGIEARECAWGAERREEGEARG